MFPHFYHVYPFSLCVCVYYNTGIIQSHNNVTAAIMCVSFCCRRKSTRKAPMWDSIPESLLLRGHSTHHCTTRLICLYVHHKTGGFKPEIYRFTSCYTWDSGHSSPERLRSGLSAFSASFWKKKTFQSSRSQHCWQWGLIKHTCQVHNGKSTIIR